MDKRSSFGSKFGMLAAAVGSAVGLGNIWKFPYVTGQNGGSAFLVVYLICVILLGFPALVTELSIGRMAGTNPVTAFSTIQGNRHWNFIGIMGVLVAFLTLGFYFIVAGWSLEYIWQTITTDSFAGMNAQDLTTEFKEFSTNTTRPYLWVIIFIFLTAAVLIFGVQKGIEAGSKILMPILFAVMLFLVIRVIFIAGNEPGYEFYLKPDFSKITPTIILQAMGQAFFSLSIGFAIMLTYGSYMKQGNVVSTCMQICILDTLIAVMAGLVIFPAVFAFGIEPTEGPSLAFIALPAVFAQMHGGMLFSVLFFFLLAVAALTSTISLYETIVVTVSELLHIGRKLSIVIIGFLLCATSAICCHSLTKGSPFVVCGKNIFDLFDYLTSSLMIPIGGMLMAIFLGWVVSREKSHKALISFGMSERLFSIFIFIIRFIIPIIILLIMLQQLGII